MLFKNSEKFSSESRSFRMQTVYLHVLMPLVMGTVYSMGAATLRQQCSTGTNFTNITASLMLLRRATHCTFVHVEYRMYRREVNCRMGSV